MIYCLTKKKKKKKFRQDPSSGITKNIFFFITINLKLIRSFII